MYTVEITKPLRVRQGLSSPVRNTQGLPPLMPEEGFMTILRVVILFRDEQINDRGWFVDTDAIEEIVAKEAEFLASAVWTELFDVRPTYERVAKLTFEKLSVTIPQLARVELDNQTIGVVTTYAPSLKG